MKTPTAPPTNGLESLRTIRHDLQREIGITAEERLAYYQEKEKKLLADVYGACSGRLC